MIFDAFRGHCVSLMRITSAAQVLETAYNDYANAQQRFNIIIEFYGVDFSVFKVIILSPSWKNLASGPFCMMLSLSLFSAFFLKNESCYSSKPNLLKRNELFLHLLPGCRQQSAPFERFNS